jgi:hypothetical protein
MALEEHNANHSHQERSTAELSFDELAKDVASGTLSRGKALRLLGAALVGGALASIPGVAWAAKGGNRECVRCCKKKYGPGRERGQCISAGARGECPVTCDGNGGGECPPGSLPPASEAIRCGPSVVAGTCGHTCIKNICTGEINCVCCDLGGPCPCLPIPDPIPPCIEVFYSCQSAEDCLGGGTTFAEINERCPGPHNPECGQSEICVGPM